MVDALDGYEYDGVALRTTESRCDRRRHARRDTIAVVGSPSSSLVDQLFHTVASPPVRYLLLLIGLALLIFEFFTAGVGIAGVVGATCLGPRLHRPRRAAGAGWAVGLIVAWRCWRSRSTCRWACRACGPASASSARSSPAWWLFEPLPGASLRPSWITLLAGIGGVLLTFVVGMPSMVRTRFATPTIGREWMIGELGDVVEAVDPDGVVSVRDAKWRARTNRATPVPVGEQVRVVIDRRRHAGGRAARGGGARPPRAADAGLTPARVGRFVCGVFRNGEPCVNSTRRALISAGAIPTVALVVTKHTHWQFGAACRGEARVDFYPPFGRERKRDRLQREQRAKAVCATCPVTTPCLEAAVLRDERYGVWGGLTFDERITFKKTA